MTKAKFKVLASEQENLKPVTEQRDYVTVDSFEALCVIKGINPSKAKPKKRTIRNLASIYQYPEIYRVAVIAKFTKPITEDTSSKSLTKAYVAEFLKLNNLVS